MCRVVFFAVFSCFALVEVAPSRILFVSPTPLLGHQSVFQPIWRELSLRGHNVTVITTDPLGDRTLTNLTELDVSFVYEVLEKKLNFTEKFFSLREDQYKHSRFFVQAMTVVNQEILAQREVQRVIQWERSKFDLVMVEYLLPAFLALGVRFKCPVIAMSAGEVTPTGHDAIGNPSHPVLNPSFLEKFGIPLSFTQRLVSVYHSIRDRMFSNMLHGYEDKVVEKFFAEGYPKLSEIAGNIDMFFMNVNPALHNVRPTVPTVIHIGGGIQIKPQKHLPKDLQKFLDDGKEGVILFSVGSVLKTKSFSPEFISAWLEAFAELPYKILWKLDEDLLQKSDNVLIKDWIPQQDVLRHPNLKLFISPGGIQSVQEAISFRVPLLLVPYCSDQFSNSLLVKNKGFGLILDFNNPNKEKIVKTAKELITNPTYKKRVDKVSEISADQPMTPLEKAVWWTEYVLRHKGAKHLRSPAIDLPLYQYFLLDVIGLIALVLGAVIFVICKLVKGVKCLFCRSKCKKPAEKVKIKKN